MIYEYLCCIYHHVWTNCAMQNSHNLHTELKLRLCKVNQELLII